jgi:hypothetical protein
VIADMMHRAIRRYYAPRRRGGEAAGGHQAARWAVLRGGSPMATTC